MNQQQEFIEAQKRIAYCTARRHHTPVWHPRRLLLSLTIRLNESIKTRACLRGGLNGVTGQPWARVSNTRAGDVLIVDDAFTCVSDNEKVVVCEDSDGLYFRCAGSHLDGQCDGPAHDEWYIGLNHADRSKD